MEEAVQNTGEETQVVDSPSTDTQTNQPVDEPQDTPQTDDTQTDEVTEVGSVEPPKEDLAPKSVNRFQEMANTIKSQSEELEKARAEKAQLLQQLTPQQQSGVQFDPNKEYTVEEYNDMLRQAQLQGAAQANLSVEQLRQEIAIKEQRRSFETNLQADISYLESTYPELNEKSDSYNPALHREVTEAYQELAINGDAVNPNISLKGIGDRIMRAANNAAATASAQTSREVAAQASGSVQQETAKGTSVDVGSKEWMQTKYDPSNPEHRRIADEYAAKHQFNQ